MDRARMEGEGMCLGARQAWLELSVDYSNAAATMPKGTVPARNLQFFFCAASAQRSFLPPRA
eukprot:302589-Chlamydomonas_euryale.AAC.1